MYYNFRVSKRGFFTMSKKSKKRNDKEKNEQNTPINEQNETTTENKTIKIDAKIAILGVVFTILFSLIIQYINDRIEIAKLTTTMENFENNLTNLDKNISEKIDLKFNDLDGNIKDINTILYSIEERLTDDEIDISRLEGIISRIHTYSVDSEFTGSFLCVSKGQDSLSWSDSTIISHDENTNINITASELKEEKLLLTYTEGDYSNIFYGQFSENNLWDGKCIINSYKDGKLYFIATSLYNNGTLIKYKQVFTDKISDEEVWVTSERFVNLDSENNIISNLYGNLDGNYGFSKIFIREKDIPMDFTLDSVKVENLIYFEDILNNDEKYYGRQISYYYGITNDGLYNDDSGNAYWIKFDENDKIDLFYQGQFVDGYPEDFTGNAWKIAWDGTGYFYYKGNFEDGKQTEPPEDYPHLTMNEINEYVSNIRYDFTNVWKEFK